MDTKPLYLFPLDDVCTVSKFRNHQVDKAGGGAPSKEPQLSTALYRSAGESATVSNKWRSALTYKGVVGHAVQTIAQNIDGNQSNLKLKIDHVEGREVLNIFAMLTLK